MRIKINDKIYRLKEIESGVDSLMELAEEPKFKDGDFVVNEAGDVLIFKEKVGDRIYDYAFLNVSFGLFFVPEKATKLPIKRHATEEEKQELLDALAEKGKLWNEEKKCIEDIPNRKFNIGDKVVLKSRPKKTDGLQYLTGFDSFIGEPLTIRRYTDNGCVHFSDCPYIFEEDWLEPYEELKKGDLAILWDHSKKSALVRIYGEKRGSFHYDSAGYSWRNAVKFESKEQYEKLINGEL